MVRREKKADHASYIARKHSEKDIRKAESKKRKEQEEREAAKRLEERRRRKRIDSRIRYMQKRRNGEPDYDSEDDERASGGSAFGSMGLSEGSGAALGVLGVIAAVAGAFILSK
mmetsp:Transcript_39998/g.103320  ORF Transcript_39998/g.103320 Transcript_39998/m.103320 type:complete len:114 (-) Transcript_39998:15825-16166(-)